MGYRLIKVNKNNILPGSVGTVELSDGSIAAADLDDASITYLKLATSTIRPSNMDEDQDFNIDITRPLVQNELTLTPVENDEIIQPTEVQCAEYNLHTIASTAYTGVKVNYGANNKKRVVFVYNAGAADVQFGHKSEACVIIPQYHVCGVVVQDDADVWPVTSIMDMTKGGFVSNSALYPETYDITVKRPNEAQTKSVNLTNDVTLTAEEAVKYNRYSFDTVVGGKKLIIPTLTEKVQGVLLDNPSGTNVRIGSGSHYIQLQGYYSVKATFDTDGSVYAEGPQLVSHNFSECGRAGTYSLSATDLFSIDNSRASVTTSIACDLTSADKTLTTTEVRDYNVYTISGQPDATRKLITPSLTKARFAVLVINNGGYEVQVGDHASEHLHLPAGFRCIIGHGLTGEVYPMSPFMANVENGGQISNEGIKDGTIKATKLADPGNVIVAASDSTAGWKARAKYQCDGTADQVEINAALTAHTGGEVILAPGNYVAAAPIAIPVGTILRGGAGQTETIITGDFAGSTFTIAANGVLNGIKASSGQAAKAIVSVGNKGEVRNCDLTTTTATDSYAISTADTGALIRNNTINTNGYGILCGHVRCRVENNYITVTGNNANGYGIRLHAANCVSDSNHIVNNNSGYGYGLVVSGGKCSVVNTDITSVERLISVQTAGENIVSGCNLSQSGTATTLGYGVNIGSTSANNTISNNVINLNGYVRGVFIDSSNNIVENNQIILTNGSSTYTGTCIFISASSNSINGNRLISNWNCIDGDNSVSSTIISNNYIFSSATDAAAIPVKVTGGDGLTFTGNRIACTAQYGFTSSTTLNRSIISNNIIVSNHASFCGIELTGNCADLQIIGNTIEHSGGSTNAILYGIKHTGAHTNTGWTIANNRIRGATYGIYLTNTNVYTMNVLGNNIYFGFNGSGDAIRLTGSTGRTYINIQNNNIFQYVNTSNNGIVLDGAIAATSVVANNLVQATTALTIGSASTLGGNVTGTSFSAGV